MKYAINLVRTLRLEEKKIEIKRARLVAICTSCFGVLGLSLFYALLQVLSMVNTLNEEKSKVARIEQEYKQYTATNNFVDRSDIELLDKLQNKKIFWTKKIAAMAQHLPENYWVTQFVNEKNSFVVSGYGYISSNQEQLITIDDYLNLLRNDRLFNDVFKNLFLKSMSRTDEETRERISFEYLALSPDGAAVLKR
jgi:hypothetical protein